MIPPFLASPGLVLKSQVQGCGFVFYDFKAATSSGGLQAKALSTTADEEGNPVPKDSSEVIF